LQHFGAVGTKNSVVAYVRGKSFGSNHWHRSDTDELLAGEFCHESIPESLSKSSRRFVEDGDEEAKELFESSPGESRRSLAILPV
jgi:hypothetical protein